MSNSQVRVTPEDFDQCADAALAVLHQLEGADWSRPAGDMTWDCRAVLEHIADDLIAYSAQLAARATDGYLPLAITFGEVHVAGALEGLRGSAAVFSSVLRAAPSGARGWHPSGMADADATAGMGIVELVVHTYDICQGLGVDWAGPEQPSRRVLARLFPDVEFPVSVSSPVSTSSRDAAPVPDVASNPDGWSQLLWATGRIALPDRPRRSTWRWYNEA